MGEKMYKRNLAEACEEYNKIFGANKNLYRIMCSFQDGLKPVARRFLYSLYKGKGRTQFIKMAKAAADTIASYHPHGGAAVEDVGVKLASPISNNIAVVEGQGNFGSYKNERAGASRYIECRLSRYALKCFFEDFEFSNVDMKLAYTGDDYEPEVLPARYPHALFNPQLSGIGYAFASNIPPFNVTEVLEATIKLIKNPDKKILLVPDSPTGADIIDDGQFETICKDGIGTFTLRGSIEVDEINNIITITSIPLQTTIDSIIKKIVELKEKKVFDEIKDIKDYTKNETGVKCIIYLDQTANPYKTIDKLYKKNTGLKKTYPVGLKMIDDYRDFDYGVISFLKEWIKYRRDSVRSSYNTKLVKTMEEQNINDVLLFILDENNAEETIKMAKESSNKNDFAKRLIRRYSIDSQQADTIANMKIYAFSKDSYENYKKKKITLEKQISELEKILDDETMIDNIIIDQLKEGVKLFGSKRKSKIIKDDQEDINDSTEYILTISTDGYVKKVPLDAQQVGQVGNTNTQYMTIRVSNNESILVFDSLGEVSKVSVNSIPVMSLDDTGVMLLRYSSVNGKVITVLVEPSDSELKKKNKDMFFTFLTRNGYVKRTLFSEFSNINGRTSAIKLSSNDELVAVEFTNENSTKDMIIYTNLGNGIRRSINEFPTMKANARGSRQMSMLDGEYCVGFNKIDSKKNYMFYITSAGRAKLTDMKYFPTMEKKENVLSLINLSSNEMLIGVRAVSRNDKVIIYKKNSQPETIELRDIPISTRIAKAEKIAKVSKGDRVLSYTVVLSNS